MLDLPTLLFVTGVVYLVMPINTWFAVRSIRQPSTLFWCVGSFMAGIAILLIGFRQELDVFWSIFFAQTLLVYSFFIRALGLQSDLSSPKTPHLLLVALTLLHSSVIATLMYAEQIYWLDVWVRTFNSILVIWFTGQIFKYATELKSRNAMGMGLIYSIVSVAFVFNMILTLTGQSSLFDHHLTVGIMVIGLAGMLSAIFGHINYLGVVYEGSIRDMALEARRKERAANSQIMVRTLTELDRQIRMGALSTSLSHAISQPLTSMLLHVRQAQKWLTAPQQDRDKATQSLNKVVDETQRAADTIEDIRQFLRPTKPNVELFEAHELLSNLRKLLHHEVINSGVILEMKMPAVGVMLYGDKLQLTHALLNLTQAIMLSANSQRGLTIHFDCYQTEQKFMMKIAHDGVSLTEKYLKIPIMIIGQFDGQVITDQPYSTQVELTAPRLATVDIKHKTA